MTFKNSIEGRLGANTRWAYLRAKELFLSPVILDPARNEFFSRRFERAIDGLSDGYSFRYTEFQGKFKRLSGAVVTNSKGKAYLTRIWSNGGERGLASCTCPDFQRNKKFKVPCKHIWMLILKQQEESEEIVHSGSDENEN